MAVSPKRKGDHRAYDEPVNARERREIKRLLAREGVSQPNVGPPHSERKGYPTVNKNPSKLKAFLNWWKRPVHILGTVAGLCITYVTAIPHMSIQEDFDPDPNNPFAQSFSIVNEGFLPATHVDLICEADTEVNNAWLKDFEMTGNTHEVDNIAPMLTYKGRFSIECDRLLKIGGPAEYSGNHLKVTVRYRMAGTIHRKQSFEFTTVRGSVGQYYWRYR